MNENMLLGGYSNERSNLVVCKFCKRPYHQETEDQEIGFKMMDYDLCPYCHNENSRSMSVEFHNSPIALADGYANEPNIKKPKMNVMDGVQL